jgi:hypothetical protein
MMKLIILIFITLNLVACGNFSGSVTSTAPDIQNTPSNYSARVSEVVGESRDYTVSITKDIQIESN